MMRNCCLGFLLSLSVLLSSCAVVENGSRSGSSLRVALPGDGRRSAFYTQTDIDKYEITITDEAGESIQKEGRPGETVSFEHLATGVYTVTVFAFDLSGYTGASGSAEAVVKKDQTCDVIIPAELLLKSDFFISGEDGVQLENHSEYIRDSRFKNYRNDVDFSVGKETVAGKTDSATSVRLKNPDIPYVYVNAKNKTVMSAVMTDPNDDVQSIRFYAKATEPSTVNFFFQDALHETHGIVLQQELTDEFPATPYHIDFSKTKRFNNAKSGTWEGMFRAVVTSGYGTVTIQMADDDTPGISGDLIHQVTIDPPDARTVKVSIVSNDTSNSDIARFEFTGTDCRAGFTGLCLENSYVLSGRVINEEDVVVEGVDIDISLSSTLAEAKSIGTIPYTPNGLFFYTADYNNGSTNGTLSAIIEKTSADGSDFGTLLLKPNKPCIIEIRMIGAGN